jgi:hypothetical protein
MTNPFDITTSQHYDVVRIGRAIDEAHNQSELRELAHHLLSAWKVQRDATSWFLEHQFRLPDAVDQEGVDLLLEVGEHPDHES